MESKEINILNSIVVEILNESEQKTLKLLLVSEEGYQKFLIKFLQLLIGQEKTISFKQFLELHNLSNKLSEFENKTNEIIEEIAELVFSGYTSENSQWLLLSKNETFLNHLLFLKEAKTAVNKTERSLMKNKLTLLDKLVKLELTDKEIKLAVILYERENIKERFKKIEQTKNPKKISFATRPPLKNFRGSTSLSALLVLLIITSTFALAISIPQVRNYIKKQFHELFNKETPEKSTSIGAKKSSPTITSNDTLSHAGIVIDSSGSVSNNSRENTSSDRINIKSTKKYNLYSGRGYNGITLKSYEKHFAIYKNDLDSIEGIWELDGKFIKYANILKSQCAIREIENNNFEMVYFDDTGRLWPLHFKYRLVKEVNSAQYELQEYANNKLISKKILLFSKGNAIRFKISMLLSEFNVVTENKSEKVQCSYVGHKKRLKRNYDY